MTPEGKIAAYLKRRAHDAGGIVRKLSYEGRIGAPDLLVCIAGRHAFVETKAPGQKPRASQSLEFERLRVHGGIEVCVIDSKKAVDMMVDDLIGCGP